MTRTLQAESNKCRDGIEYVKAFPKEYNIQTSIQHWQLRDLIGCPENKTIVNVQNNSIFKFNLSLLRNYGSPILPSLSFQPTSLTTGCGYVAAGGTRSQLVVKNLDNDWEKELIVGGSINNSINISQHCGETRLLISNNDETIKVYSLPSLLHITDIQLTTAVNYTSVSPDGTKLVAVGDSSEVFLYDIRNSGYHQIATHKGSNDGSFSCSWNHSSDIYAIASQDGYVTVFDLRSSKRLSVLSAKQLSHNVQATGACRNVKFSPVGSIDLLLFAEHTTYLHLVDARTFNEQQILKVPTISSHSDSDSKADIAGICFSPDGKYIYAGTTSLVAEYDVDTVVRRCFPKGSII